jgi:hypothetical protein
VVCPFSGSLQSSISMPSMVTDDLPFQKLNLRLYIPFEYERNATEMKVKYYE